MTSKGGPRGRSARRLYILGALAAVTAVAVISVRLYATPDQRYRARVPAIDIHTHLGGVEMWPGSKSNFAEILRSMDAGNIGVLVDFKAPYPGHEVYGERVTQRLSQYPDRNRFKLFANVPIATPQNIFLAGSMPGYRARVAEILKDAVERGASGLKLKFQGGPGYWVYDEQGLLVPLDTPELDGLWSEAERLGVPVLLHFAEAYKSEHQPGRPSSAVRWEILMHERERVLRKHPRLLLIGAHWGSSAQDLSYLAEVLERYPNFYLDGNAHQAKDAFGTLDPYTRSFLTTFQDRLLFGTDYMEATFSWLTSYGQRLDMMLPWIEEWWVADAVFEKFYRATARKLLRLSPGSSLPVAHPGFTQTRLVGQQVRLDGSGSYEYQGALLTYAWRQLEGPPVQVSGAGPSATFVPAEEGRYVFELAVSNGHAGSAPRPVAVNVVGRPGTFRESGGRVVIEAENFWRKTGRASREWVVGSSKGGFSGRGYMEARPAAPAEQGGEQAPGLEYKIEIHTPGTYVVYARGQALDASAAGLGIGLDGEEAALADDLGGFTTAGWSWVNETHRPNRETDTPDRNLAVLNIAEPGPHIVSVWVRRGGVRLDRLILARQMYSQTKFPLYDPGPGAGPPESHRISR